MTTYSLYSGSGPALVGYSGPFQSGITFEVTTGNCWFNAYRWWVPSGGDTGAQKFALWCITVDAATGNSLISGSVVTSGTLTANAWNVVSLPVPVQLSIGCAYVAATGWTAVNGFPDTNNQFGSGDPFSAGITNGPLFAYSSGTGTAGAPLMGSQGSFGDTTGQTDPSVYMPIGSSNDANFGMDVVVSNTAPSGYNGSYRIWPNFAGVGPQLGISGSGIDANDPYILATEFTLSQACTLNHIWFYSPATVTQLPTQCAIWNVSAQTMVAGTLQTSPSWSGAAGSGWISVSYTGVTLPAGDYKTSVWNATASGTGTGWNEYSPEYFTTGAGTAGITSGPITVPNVTNATSPGQATYQSSSSTFLYPDLYVSSGTPGQSYWVDVEVTPQTSTYGQEIQLPLIPPGLYTSPGAVFPQPFRGDPGLVALTHNYPVSLGATLALTGTATRQVSRPLAGTVALTATAARDIGKPVAGTVALVPAVTRSAGKPLAGTVMLTASSSSRISRVLAVPVALTAAAARQVSRPLSTVVALTSTLTRSVGKSLAGQVALTASLSVIKAHLLQLTAALALTGQNANRIGKALSAVTALTGGVIRSTGKAVSGTTAALVAFSASKTHIIAASTLVAVTGAVSRTAQLHQAVTAAITGTAGRSISRPLAAVTAILPALTKRVTRSFTASTAVTGTLAAGRAFLVALSTALGTAGSVIATVSQATSALVIRFGSPAVQWVTGMAKKAWRAL
jgi:hypothetical protein